MLYYNFFSIYIKKTTSYYQKQKEKLWKFEKKHAKYIKIFIKKKKMEGEKRPKNNKFYRKRKKKHKKNLS